MREQRHEIDHIDHPDFQFGQVMAQPPGRSYRFRGGISPAQASITSGPRCGRCWPIARQKRRACSERLRPWRAIAVATAYQSRSSSHSRGCVNSDRQRRAGNWHLAAGRCAPRCLFGKHDVNEARSLMTKAVVIVAPAGRGEQNVERGNRLAPGQSQAFLQPLSYAAPSWKPKPSQKPRRWQTGHAARSSR